MVKNPELVAKTEKLFLEKSAMFNDMLARARGVSGFTVVPFVLELEYAIMRALAMIEKEPGESNPNRLNHFVEAIETANSRLEKAVGAKLSHRAELAAVRNRLDKEIRLLCPRLEQMKEEFEPYRGLAFPESAKLMLKIAENYLRAPHTFSNEEMEELKKDLVVQLHVLSSIEIDFFVSPETQMELANRLRGIRSENDKEVHRIFRRLKNFCDQAKDKDTVARTRKDVRHLYLHIVQSTDALEDEIISARAKVTLKETMSKLNAPKPNPRSKFRRYVERARTSKCKRKGNQNKGNGGKKQKVA